MTKVRNFYFAILLGFHFSLFLQSVCLATREDPSNGSSNLTPESHPERDGVSLGHVTQTASGGLFFKRALEESLKPESLGNIIQNFQAPTENWAWDLEHLVVHGAVTEFRYQIRRTAPTVAENEESQQSNHENHSTQKGMWDYLKSLATTASSAAYHAALDPMTARSLTGQVTVQPWTCSKSFDPHGYLLGVDLMKSDILVHHLVEKAWIVLCLKETDFPDKAIEITLDLQMIAKPGTLFGNLNREKMEDFSASFSKSWLDGLVTTANFHEVRMSHELNNASTLDK